MKLWHKILIGVGSAGAVVGVIAWRISSKIDYRVLNTAVDLLDNEKIVFRINYGIDNDSNTNVKVIKQRYTINVAGHDISTAESNVSSLLLKGGMSTMPLNVTLRWDELREKVPAFSGIDWANISELPVLIKGRLSARLGAVPMPPIPVRLNMKVGDLI